MKVCAIVFNILGMVITLISSILNISTAETTSLVWVYVVLLVLCLITGSLALISLGKNKKSVAIGVFALLFNGLIGGILYLSWKPESRN